MRLAINASLLDRRPSGLGLYTENIVRELLARIEKDDHVAIYTTCPDKFVSRTLSSTFLKNLPFFLEPRYGTKAALARFIWTQTLLPFSLQRPTVLYSPTHHGMLLSKSHIRQVITVHDLLPIKYPRQYRLQHYYFAHILPLLIQKASAVVVDSQNTRRDVHHYYGTPLEKLHVVYGAVDPVFHPHATKHREDIKGKFGLCDYVLVVGASYPHKNIDRVLDAFVEVQCVDPNLGLTIVGGQEGYISHLKWKAKDLGIKKLTFLKYVTREELRSLYCSARLLIYPSLYEGFGLPPLEAMLCGCPVIASNTSSLPEVCGDAAYYIDPCSIEGISKAVNTVSSNENLRSDLRQKGFLRAVQFSWDKAARQIYSLLNVIDKQMCHN